MSLSPITAEGLGKDFREGFMMRKKTALESVTFSVRSGEIYGFLGPNGAGKSTTLHLLLAFLTPSRGRATLSGLSPSNPEARRSVGFLPEIFSFDRFSTGAGLLRRFDALAGRSVEGREERLRSALEAVDLASAARRRIGSYSKGMTQRIGLAQALLGDPDLLILDEPMSGMDPATRLSVMNVLRRRRDAGKTTLFSSHILPDVEMIADRVLILDGGRTVKEGAMADIAERPDGSTLVFKDENPGRFDQSLAALGMHRVAVEGQPALSLVEAQDAPAKNAALALLAGAGADIVSVTPRRANLEAIFLDLTRGKSTGVEGPAQ